MAELVEAAEAVEEFVDVITVVDRRLAYLSLGFGVISGAFLGYAFAGKKFSKRADEEIAEMREHFLAKTVAQEPKPDLEEVVTELGYKSPVVAKEDFILNEEKPPVVNVQTVNIFNEAETDDEEWDYSKEIKSRDETKPYIIHFDEHHAGDLGYDQMTLTYFTGDDVLCDERDTPVDNRDALVGDENLERFGHGSKDPNALYIRNEPLNLDIEIVRSAGTFATEVHGFQPDELSHSDNWRRKQMRRFIDDESS